MRRFLSVLLVCFLLRAIVLPAAAQEPTPFGQVVTTLPVQATGLLTDQVRQWVYAITSDKTVTVIDTTTLTVIAVIPLDIQPGFMALSENGALLYVASESFDRPTIAVLDMNLLRVVDSFQFANNVLAPVTGLVAGRGNRLYLASGAYGGGLYQIDGTTGEIQATLASTFSSDLELRSLAISPDRGTLYVSDYAKRYGNLTYLLTYDVSGPDAQMPSQRPPGLGAQDSSAVSDHGGYYLLRTKVADESGGPYRDAAILSATDVSQRLSTLNRRGRVGGPFAFSLDDSVVFEAFDPGGGKATNQIELWRTADGTLLGETSLTYPDQGNHPFGGMTVDASGAYLLAVQQAKSSRNSSGNMVTVLSTGFAAQPPPAPARPRVSVATLVASTAVGQPPGKWQLSRTGDLSAPLTVAYMLTGTAENGHDYRQRTGSVVFPAGSRRVNITIVPKGNLDGQPSKVVNLILQPGDEYRRGAPFKGRITILAPAGG